MIDEAQEVIVPECDDRLDWPLMTTSQRKDLNPCRVRKPLIIASKPRWKSTDIEYGLETQLPHTHCMVNMCIVQVPQSSRLGTYGLGYERPCRLYYISIWAIDASFDQELHTRSVVYRHTKGRKGKRN